MISTSTISYIAQTSLAVTFLICLVLLVRKPFAKAFGANAAYALWLVPLLRLVMPPVPANWTLFGWMQFGGTPAADAVAPATVAISPHYAVSEGMSILPSPPVGPQEIVFTEFATEPTRLAIAADFVASALPTLGVIWLIGAGLVLLTGFIRQQRAAELVDAEAVNAGLAVQTAAMNVRQAIGLKRKTVSVQTSFISSGPLVIGLFRPTVLVPAWFELDYSPAEQRVALMHEMMHIKRGDLWALQAAWIGVALQWFNPLAWIALEKFRVDQEAACDADVLAIGETSPHNYGAALVKSVRLSRPVAQPVQAASLPLNHALYERLSQMKNPLPTARQRFNGSLLAASVGAVALLASACAASTAQTADLAGAPDAQSTSTEKRTVIVNDGEKTTQTVTVIRDGEVVENYTLDLDLEGLAGLAELEGLADLEGLAELEGLEGLEGLAKLEALEELEGMAIFMGDDENTFAFATPPVRPPHIAPPAGVAEFQREMRRLARDPEANAAEIKALSDSFEAEMEAWETRHEAEMKVWEEAHEARMEAWEEQHEARMEAWEARREARAEAGERFADARVRVLRKKGEAGDHVFAWHGDTGAVQIECSEEGTRQRVISIQRDGEEETRTVTADCVSLNAEAINVDEIMAELRADGELTEERLAEVRQRLEAAREKLDGMDLEFDFEFEEPEAN